MRTSSENLPRFRGTILGIAGLALSLALTLPRSQAADPEPEPQSGAGARAGASRLAGNWEGTLKVSGIALRLAFHVKQPEPDKETVTATFDSIDQGATGLPVDAVAWEEKERTASFRLGRFGASFEGKLDAEGTQIEGVWSQGGAKLPLVLRRTAQVSVLKRPQTPVKPYPYVETLLKIENAEGGVTLAGTLTTPQGTGPFPAVVLISGSGAQDRDETILGHKPFLVLADELTRLGVAVLRVDDRGMGGSTGKTLSATSADCAGDVLAEVAALKGRPEINPARIGLIGHSEGGLIAAMVAARSPDVAFIILLAGTGLPGEEIVLRQQELLLRAGGADDAALRQARAVQRRVLEIVKTTQDPREAANQLRAVVREAVAALPEDQRKHAAEQNAGPLSLSESQIALAVSPWYRFFLTYDPRPALARVKCPVLALIGEKDLQVAPRENLEAIAGALRSGGNTHAQVEELPGLNHLFQTCRTGSVTEYGAITETIAPAALKRIGEWVGEQTARR